MKAIRYDKAGYSYNDINKEFSDSKQVYRNTYSLSNNNRKQSNRCCWISCKNVLYFKKPSNVFIILAVMLVAALSAGCTVNRETTKKLSDDTEPQSIETTYSPDNKYYIEGYGVDYGTQVSGLNPIKQFRIAETNSDKTVWSTDGPYLFGSIPPFVWSPDGRYVYVAFAGRTWKDGLIVDTADMSEQPLPGITELAPLFPDTTPDDNRPDPYIVPVSWQEYKLTVTFSWRVKEDVDNEENRFYGEYLFDANNGNFTLPDSNKSIPIKNIIPLYSAQITHDDSIQMIELDTSRVESDGIYILSVVTTDGKTLWQSYAGLPHSGWNALFLTHIGGKDYLMQYNPTTYQGSSTYAFRVFSLDNEGNEIILDKGEVDFSINPTNEKTYFRKHDISPVKAFYEQVAEYLSVSELLLNTDLYITDRLPESQRSRSYGTKDEPIILRDYFYKSADLTIDEQMDMFIQDYINEYGELED